MAHVLVLTADELTHVLPSLMLLSHQVHTIVPTPQELVQAPDADLVLIDARTDLAQAKALCQVLRSTGLSRPLMIITGEGSLNVVDGGWGIDDVLLTSASPVELDMRIRMALQKVQAASRRKHVRAEGLVIDEENYVARVDGTALNLTFKEFELLRFLATHPARVFTREQLLSEVWGYDYFGGTRTVDVHVRRLRAKLGDLEQLIGTVRNVGYRFNADVAGAPEVARTGVDA